MDFLDLLHIKDEEVLSGTYYARRPKTPQDSGVPFEYDIVSESTQTYATILGNLRADTTFQTIKTNDLCDFKKNGYCATQEGGFWQIVQIETRIVSPKNKDALRIVRRTIETEYILRLIKVDNPWGLQ